MSDSPAFQKLIQQYAVIRKGLDYLQHLPRAVVRMRSKAVDYQASPPLLANSFPKSGTHLLLQILKVIPGVTHRGAFIASMPSLTYREQSSQRHLKMLNNLVPGEVVPAHLFHDPGYRAELKTKNCVHYFIYRDPRDVAVSEAIYLASMNRWHRMHGYFVQLEDLDQQISTAIIGVQRDDFPYDYPDIGKRFARYRGWLDSPDVFAVRYEDLNSAHRVMFLTRMALFYEKHLPDQRMKIDRMVEAMENSIQPEQSHTFRKGIVGGWKDVFKPVHVAQFKQVAGELLIDLGYEQDVDWAL